MNDDGELIPFSSVVTPQEKAYRAYQMRLAGVNNIEIANKLGYPNPNRVSKEIAILVNKAMKTVDADRRAEVVELELDRLDAMQSSIWGVALAGDYKAIDAVLKIMQHRARLLSLGSEGEDKSSKTVIIAADDYANTLKDLTR
jgi:hypothetical protein